MTRRYRIALVGDHNPAVVAHQAIPQALRLAGAQSGRDVEGVWVHTSSITAPAAQFADYDGIWCVPASPYANTEGALAAIRYAREERVPFLGTCGGFQHAVIEYARNVCALQDAGHAELKPDGTALVISALACALVEKSEAIELAEGSILHNAYGRRRITEGYHCRYGINPEYEPLLFENGLRPTARGASGEVRAIELSGHPFFVATLFQAERRALADEVPPPVLAFVESLGRETAGRP